LFPVQLLDIIVRLFSDCVSGVKWDRLYSSMFVIIRLEFVKVRFYHVYYYIQLYSLFIEQQPHKKTSTTIK